MAEPAAADDDSLATLLASVRLDQYAAAIVSEGYVYAADLCEAEEPELEDLIAALEMKRPEARRLAKAIATRTEGGGGGGTTSPAQRAATTAAKGAQVSRTAKLRTGSPQGGDYAAAAALDAAARGRESLSRKADALQSAEARLAAQQAEMERLQRDILDSQAALQQKLTHQKRQSAGEESGDVEGDSSFATAAGDTSVSFSTFAAAAQVAASELLEALMPPQLVPAGMGDDAVFAATTKQLTPSALGAAPVYPSAEDEGFLLTPAANEYTAAATGNLSAPAMFTPPSLAQL